MPDTALPLIITDAGRQAAIDAEHNGLQLELSEIALGRGLWSPDASATGLKDEIKRLTNLGGVDLAADMLHLTITDDTTDAYELGEFGLYSDTGVLFALYSQAQPISEKIAESILMLSADIKLDTVPAGSVTISGNNFYYPPATPTLLGVMYDAPRDGKNYVRKNGAWLEVPPQDNEWRPGDIKMTAGREDQIQSGWQLCNGVGQTSNGIQVPNLLDRMVICSGKTYTTGDTGGSAREYTSTSGNHSHSISIQSTTLSKSQMPAHSHRTYNTSSAAYGNSEIRADSYGGGNSNSTPEWNKSRSPENTGGSYSHSHSGSSYSAGSHSHSVSTMSPYYALAFIIKL